MQTSVATGLVALARSTIGEWSLVHLSIHT